MKFINYLESITGIGIYPLTSFMIFFLFFLAVSFYVIRAGKKHFESVSQIPLDINENENSYEKNNIATKTVFFASIMSPLVALAQDGEVQTTGTVFSNPLFNTLLFVIIVLTIMIVALSGALKNIMGSDMFVEKVKKDREEKNTNLPKITGLVALLSFISTSLTYAQSQVTKAANDGRIGGLDASLFYILLIVIAVELIVLALLFNTFKSILETKKEKAVAAAKPKTKTILDRLNDMVELEQEESIMLDHDYDGIKELDNNLPPWWKYGFYLTIVVAVIYLINYHITKTAPLQAEEYAISIKKGEAEVAEYMKTSANNVDENTVVLLTDPSDVSEGKDLFIATCAACHGMFGEGTVGPNLTDEYWVHGGGVKDIFKTIKYGWPDKGMKSWKEDFSPIQIAQITSFIRTLKGTNPAKQKEKQGELYIEKDMPLDSAAVKADSINVTDPKTLSQVN